MHVAPSFKDTAIGLRLQFGSRKRIERFLRILQLTNHRARDPAISHFVRGYAQLQLLKGKMSPTVELTCRSKRSNDGFSLIRVVHDLSCQTRGTLPPDTLSRTHLLRELSRVHSGSFPDHKHTIGDYVFQASHHLQSHPAKPLPKHLYPSAKEFCAYDVELPRTLYEPFDDSWYSLTYSSLKRPATVTETPSFGYAALDATLRGCNSPVLLSENTFVLVPVPEESEELRKFSQAAEDLIRQVQHWATTYLSTTPAPTLDLVRQATPAMLPTQQAAPSSTSVHPLSICPVASTPRHTHSPVILDLPVPTAMAPGNPAGIATRPALGDDTSLRDAACIAKILILQCVGGQTKINLSAHTIFKLESIDHLTSPTGVTVEAPPQPSTVPSSTDTPVTSLEQVRQEIQEYLTTECGWQGGLCTQPNSDLRPDEFPEHLWQYVPVRLRTGTPATEEHPSIPSIQQEWAAYTPSRLRELVEAIMKIDISTEDEGRILEEPLVRAHTLAHLTAYGHADPTNPPRFRGQQFKIALKDPNCSPVHTRPRRSNVFESQSLAARVEDMMSRSLLRRSKSTWNSAVRMVADEKRIMDWIEKHGGNALAALYDPIYRAEVKTLYRLTGDFRQLNDLTTDDPYPLPLIADFLDRVKDVTRFSTGDIEDAFFTVDMDERSRQYTAFHTPRGLVEYTVMAQGLKNAATFWARIIGEAFEHMRNMQLFVYQDDVVNHDSNSLRRHLDTQRNIYCNLRRHDLVFKPTKAHLNYRQMKILGHMLSRDGRRPDPSLTKAIIELDAPTTLTDVRKLLGLAQVAREYIHGLSQLVEPIQRLVTKNVLDIKAAWEADPTCDIALEQLKRVLTSAPVLMIADPLKPFRVHVDASKTGHGIGAILLQMNDNGQWQPVAYWSRTLTSAERRYSATELECTALHNSILHWHNYLSVGAPFEVVVDHYALVYMVTKPAGDTYGRLARLCLDIQSYTFTIIHRSGALHLDADGVSRLLRKNEVAYVYTADDLRDDIGPLTPEERAYLRREYFREHQPETAQDLEFIIKTINDHRLNRLEMMTSTELAQVREKIERTNRSDVRRSAGVPYTPQGDRPGKHLANRQGLGPGLHMDSDPPSTDLSPVDSDRPYFLPDWVAQQCESAPTTCTPTTRTDGTPAPLQVTRIITSTAGFSRRLSGPDWEITVWQDPDPTPASSRAQQLQHLRYQASEYLRTKCGWVNGHHPQVSMPITIPSIPAVLWPYITLQIRGHLSRMAAQVAHTPPQGLHEMLLQAKRIRQLQLVTMRRQAHREKVIDKVLRLAMAKARKTATPPQPMTLDLKQAAEISPQALELQRRLGDTEYLVTQHYIDPTTRQLYEVINTYAEAKVLYSTARPVDAAEGNLLDDTQLQKRPVYSEDVAGTADLVAELTLGSTVLTYWPAPTSADWQAAIQDDPICKAIWERLTTDGADENTCLYLKPRDSSDFFYIPRLPDGSLGPLARQFTLHQQHQVHNTTCAITTLETQLVVPARYQPACMYLHHEALGHPGARKTTLATRAGYYWHTLKADTVRHVKRCHFCRQRKANYRVAKPPIQTYEMQDHPWSRAHCDLAGPFNRSTNGYVYIMVYKCALTKYIEIFALTGKHAEEVVNCLVDEVFSRHGQPKVLITDRGTEFTNTTWQEVVALLNTRHIKITAQNPASNGQVENQMRTIKDMLKSFINEFQDDWDKYLAVVAHAYRTTINEATGYSPYYLLHGREAPQPAEHFIQLVPPGRTATTYAKGLRRAMIFLWQHVGKRVIKNVDRMNKRPVTPLQFHPYKVGDAVMVRQIPQRFAKTKRDSEKVKIKQAFQMRYTGPYYIIEVLSPVLYACDVHNARKVVHVNKMKPC